MNSRRIACYSGYWVISFTGERLKALGFVVLIPAVSVGTNDKLAVGGRLMFCFYSDSGKSLRRRNAQRAHGPARADVFLQQ